MNAMSFDLTALGPDWFNLKVAVQILPELVAAAWVTIYVTLISFVLSLIVGLLLLLLRRSRSWLVARPTALFIEFVRSTPLLVQIYFFFFVMPELGVTLSPIATGIAAIATHYSCYMSEVYRSGLESIPHGQWDA